MISQKRKAIGRVVLLILILFIGAPVAWDAYRGPQELGETTVEIGGELFTVPAEWDHWRYEYMGDAMGGKFKQLQFTLDINTFEPIQAEYGPNGSRNFHMEIRPLRSEFGEKPYWTDKDPAIVAEPSKCGTTIVENNDEFEVCEYDASVRLNSYAHGGYAIRNKKTGAYISMFGCIPKKFKPPNRVCTGRARVLDNIQIEYGYREEHFDKAIELDQRARRIALSLHQDS